MVLVTSPLGMWFWLVSVCSRSAIVTFDLERVEGAWAGLSRRRWKQRKMLGRLSPRGDHRTPVEHPDVLQWTAGAGPARTSVEDT